MIDEFYLDVADQLEWANIRLQAKLIVLKREAGQGGPVGEELRRVTRLSAKLDALRREFNYWFGEAGHVPDDLPF